MAIKINTKYAVGLSLMANSFFDPESGCNLFRSTPVYMFNHKPTKIIKAAVESGRLKDLVGNILEDKEVVVEVPPADENKNTKSVKGGKAKADKEEASAEGEK